MYLSGSYEEYDAMLDEVYGTVTIGEYEYPTSRALKYTDHLAYHTGYADYVSTLEEDN